MFSAKHNCYMLIFPKMASPLIGTRTQLISPLCLCKYNVKLKKSHRLKLNEIHHAANMAQDWKNIKNAEKFYSVNWNYMQ